MNGETTFLMRAFGIVVTLFAGAFGLGKYNANVVKKKELYDIKDGSLIYLTAESFEKAKESCQGNINAKLDDINSVLIKRHDEDIKIANFMGRIEEFMETYKK